MVLTYDGALNLVFGCSHHCGRHLLPRHHISGVYLATRQNPQCTLECSHFADMDALEALSNAK